ncbi:MAG: hypothetical protein GY861_14545 [bacterium]|nr:hypothetical protein [bacterium]
MSDKCTPREVIKEDSDPVEIFSKDENVDEMWGIGANFITLEQIEQLKNGKCAYFDDGEYAHIIFIKD